MKIIKKFIGLALILVVCTACATSTVIDPDDMDFAYSTDTLGVRTGASNTQRTEENPFRIGIIQYGTHASLDDTFIGIKRELDNSDFNISFEYQNGNLDPIVTENIANKMVLDGYDVIIPIATNASVATFKAAQYRQTPIVFSSVSDPIGAGLVSSLIAPNSYITGTATLFNPILQLDLIQEVQPDIKSIGVIYSLFEPNALSNLATLREEATRRGIEILSVGITSPDDITTATYSIITDIDAITTLPDSNIVSNIDTILEITNIANVPMYGTDKAQVDLGCIAAQNIDYISVGEKTAQTAISILMGKDVSTIPVSIFTADDVCFNQDVLDLFNLEIPTIYDTVA